MQLTLSGPSGDAPTVDILRARMGGEKAAPLMLLDVDWRVEANDPRARVRHMLAAGWRPIDGSLSSHPRWARTLDRGPNAGTRQVINFSGSPSVFCWNAQTSDLARADRAARGEC